MLWAALPAVIGVIYGHLSAAGADTTSRTALTETLAVYAARAHAYDPHRDLWIGVGLALATALLLYLSGKTPVGLLLIPVAVLAHSYLLSYTVTSVLLTAGRGFSLGELFGRAGIALLPVCLLEWPAMLLLAVQSSAEAGRRLIAGDAQRVPWETSIRAALCGLSLCLAAAVRAWPVPWLLTTFLL